MLRIDQRIVMVVRKTRMDDLLARFGTRGQASFVVKRAKVNRAAALARGKPAAQLDHMVELAGTEALHDMARVEEEGKQYQEIVGQLRGELDFDLPVQVVDRALVPSLVLGPKDVVVVVGQDGLVANVAKYALGLPIVGVNPDPRQYDGILLPFGWRDARQAVQRVLEGRYQAREVTLAEARLNDGQRLLAFNDLFIGARSHVSARYRLEVGGRTEPQSSSGVLVSTGAGSTGWFSSVLNMARGVVGGLLGADPRGQFVPMAWEDRRLAYVVREPFVSRTSKASLVAGVVDEGAQLTLESLMGKEGTIFSDGVEADALDFGEGTIATVGVAKERARLVVPS